ncbi:MAG: MFS transporter [Myxococcales bacterium]
MSKAWLMVAITFLTQFLAMGFTFYSLGIVYEPMEQEFEVNRATLMMLPTAMSVGGMLMAPFLGKWAGKGSIRNMMCLGCLAMGVGFLLSTQVTELWQLIAIFGTCMTFAAGTMGGVTTQALVVNWFQENRTMALGISMMGMSLSGAVMAPVANSIVSSDGWREAYELFGYVTLAAIPLVWFTVVGRPSELPSSNSKTVHDGMHLSAAPDDFSMRDGLKERNLWIIAIVCGLSFMATTALLNNIILHATGEGMDKADAAFLVSMLAIGAAAGKLVFGWAANRFGEQRSLMVAIAAQTIGISILLVDIPYAALLSSCLVLGVGLGGVMPLGAALLARAFGPAKFGPMMGLMAPIMIPFQATGPPAAAAVYDSTGSYDIAWMGLVVVTFIALGLLTLLRIPANKEPAAT